MQDSPFMQGRWFDLTHELNETIPVWPGSVRFSRELKVDYDKYGFRVYSYHSAQGIGTHIDAPSHVVAGGRSINNFVLEDWISPACVIDVCRQVAQKPDYQLSVADLADWEDQYGKLPARALVLCCTGWDQYWKNEQQYRNADLSGVMHFPGFSKAAVNELLKSDITGIGIDTFSLDPGNSVDYAVHHLLLGAGKYQIENLTNLASLPAVGAWVLALPIKVSDGPEAPARVVAWCPN